MATGLEPEPAAKFFVMGPETVLLNLNKPLPKVEHSTFIQWDPAGKKTPNEAWLIDVCDYFSSLRHPNYPLKNRGLPAHPRSAREAPRAVLHNYTLTALKA